MGLCLGFWAPEITLDTALDECASLSLTPVAVLSLVVQLLLIVVLTTKDSCVGHMVMWLKAAEVLLATICAKTVDHPYWINIAILATSFIAAVAASGHLAPLPPNVPMMGAVSYFTVTVLANTAYQLVQNFKWGPLKLIGNVKIARASLCCLSMWLCGTPPSWILFDSINFSMFFLLKVATDTVALMAVSAA